MLGHCSRTNAITSKLLTVRSSNRSVTLNLSLPVMWPTNSLRISTSLCLSARSHHSLCILIWGSRDSNSFNVLTFDDLMACFRTFSVTSNRGSSFSNISTISTFSCATTLDQVCSKNCVTKRFSGSMFYYGHT